MIYSAASIILQEPIQASAAHVEETDEGRFKVVWYGYQWGGDFRYRSDAQLCTAWCCEQTLDDGEAWVAQHADWAAAE